MSSIKEIAGLVGTGFKIILILIFAIVILMAFIHWFVDSQETLHRNAEVVLDTGPIIADNLIKSCEVLDTTLESLNETLAQSLENEVARELAGKLLDDNKLSKCEWYELTNHLTEWEKRKLRVSDLVCDFSSCLEYP